MQLIFVCGFGFVGSLNLALIGCGFGGDLGCLFLVSYDLGFLLWLAHGVKLADGYGVA